MKIILFIIFFSQVALAVQIDINSQTYSAHKLLEHKSLKKISLPHDPSYKGKVKYFKAVPLRSFISEHKKGYDLKFEALDGFVSLIPMETIFHPKATPHIAIEDSNSPWPKSFKGKSAGPFYLIWTDSENILQEQWPFQIKKISMQKGFEIHYPKLFPKKMGPKQKRGLHIFKKNCFPCHKVNGEGEGEMGPDLNTPMNPLDYIKEDIFVRFIRNPKSIRKWKNMGMPGFDEKQISSDEMHDLIAYLKSLKSN